MKNVIFDFGQVLVRFDPIYMTSRYVSDEDDVRDVANVLFDRLYWDRLDAGTIEDEEVVRLASQRVPQRLRGAIADVYYNWIYNIPEIEGMREAIAICREKGFGVYLLSNISHYFADRKEEIPILSLLDGYVFSAQCGCVKPSREIFAHTCDKFGLDPSQTLFVDDSEKNIKGAIDFGLTGYLFDGDSGKLCAYLKTL